MEIFLPIDWLTFILRKKSIAQAVFTTLLGFRETPNRTLIMKCTSMVPVFSETDFGGKEGG